MTALIATLIFAVFILVLLRFTREPGAKRSAAVWIAFAWLWFASSRNPSLWVEPQGTFARAAGSAYDEGNGFDRSVLMAIMLMAVIVLVRRTQRTTSFLAANIPVLLFFFYCGLSVIWSEHPDVSVRRWFRSLGDLLMVMVVLTDADWVGAFKWLYVRLACFLVPLSILFFRFYPHLGRAYNVHDGRVTVTGVSDDKNALGMICMLFTLAVGWSMLQTIRMKEPHKKRILLGYCVLLAMSIYLIWIANSATAVACLILGGGILILTNNPKISRRPALTHLIVAAALGISALSLFAGTALVELLGRNSTLTGRTDLWALCLTLVRNPLLGAGYESFWLGWRLEKMWNYIQGTNQAHNGYLEIYLNLGWFGLVWLCTLLISGYRNITHAVARQEEAGSLRLAYFVAACIYNVTEAGFKMMHPMWIILLMVSAARPAPSFVREELAIPTSTLRKKLETRKLVSALDRQKI